MPDLGVELPSGQPSAGMGELPGYYRTYAERWGIPGELPFAGYVRSGSRNGAGTPVLIG